MEAVSEAGTVSTTASRTDGSGAWESTGMLHSSTEMVGSHRCIQGSCAAIHSSSAFSVQRHQRQPYPATRWTFAAAAVAAAVDVADVAAVLLFPCGMLCHLLSSAIGYWH